MTPILDSAFNALTVDMASRLQWIPVDYDPYPTLSDMRRDYELTGRIKVSTLHSDNSIYGDPFINWCSRAWHDYTHLAVNAEFDAEGERLAASYQMLQIQELWASRKLSQEQSITFKRIIDAEVNGQVEYYLQHGTFPANGYEFTRERIGV